MSLAINIIYSCLTDRGSKEGHRALLVSPYQSQTEEVIDTIKLLCNTFNENPIQSAKASPVHIIKFKNGAILKGYTAATNGDSVRGQPADSIWLDEFDDIPAKAIVSVMGVLLDNPDVKVWRSGTPKGELNLFTAANDPQTKEFHYPSYVIPHFNDTLDKQLRSDMDEISYLQEVVALYGIMANGIFQQKFVDRSQNKPKYISPLDVLSNRNSYIVILGVDWNHDEVGTRIVVTVYDKNDPQFYILDKERVAIEGWTQQAAIDKIIMLNRKYHCDHIFVDAGFGATQIGDLRLYGEMQVGKVPKGHADLKLMDVEAVDFGSSVEVKDPTTGESFKQGLKQFAVQNTVLCLEKDLLTLHPEHDKDIVKQMKNYIQKSRNKGKVVYGYISKKIGDHDLDALMISLYGFKKLYSSVLGGAYESAMLRFSNYKDKESGNTVSVDVEEIDPRVAIRFGGSRVSVAKITPKVVKYNSKLPVKKGMYFRK